ncbi:MAG: hypothetical protein GF418_15945 [Chitinivibrionales bacterium]|nr:hypothetical protein [Chitinivibrionales bacterium]MBD3397113.1 hypothetical protein [Chitinivibrionales bacterium]
MIAAACEDELYTQYLGAEGTVAMSVTVSENERFIYVRYHRQEFRDSDQFKRVLSNQASALAGKDVVVDLSTCNSLTSPEIGAMARLLQAFQGSPRFLRILPNEEVKRALESTNITKMDNLVMYDGQKQFVEEVKRAAEGGPS